MFEELSILSAMRVFQRRIKNSINNIKELGEKIEIYLYDVNVEIKLPKTRVFAKKHEEKIRHNKKLYKKLNRERIDRKKERNYHK